MPGRWRTGATFQELLDHMDEFWRSPRGQRLKLPNGLLRQNCRRGWPISLAVSFTATAGWCPSSGSRRGRAQLLFPRTWWEWDIELDLREQQHRLARGDVIATGTIAAEGYGNALGTGPRSLSTPFGTICATSGPPRPRGRATPTGLMVIGGRRNRWAGRRVCLVVLAGAHLRRGAARAASSVSSNRSWPTTATPTRGGSLTSATYAVQVGAV